jgi:biopolymer transport protein ExbB
MQAFLDFVVNHWFFAIPMFLMSLAAVTMLVWRLMLNMNAKTDLNLFLPRFQEILQKEGIEGGLKFCKAQPPTEVIPRKLFVAGLETARQGTAAMRRAMANVMELEIIPDLNFLLAPILAIAKIATMVGLLGTVISMIDTFQQLGKAKDAAEGTGGGAADTSSAIGLALFATALGLMTAIPLVFAHVLMKNWIHKYEVKMKSSGAKLILLVQQLRNAPMPPAGPPGAGPPAQPGQRPIPVGTPVRPGA